MVSTGKKPRAASAAAPDDSVDTFLDELRHPERALIDALCALLSASVPDAVEQVKWSAPSFAKSVHFATLNLRAKRGVQLVLHLGAKPRSDLDMRVLVEDPAGLLDWKGSDRALVSVPDVSHLAAIDTELRRVVKAWARFVD